MSESKPNLNLIGNLANCSLACNRVVLARTRIWIWGIWLADSYLSQCTAVCILWTAWEDLCQEGSQCTDSTPSTACSILTSIRRATQSTSLLGVLTTIASIKASPRSRQESYHLRLLIPAWCSRMASWTDKFETQWFSKTTRCSIYRWIRRCLFRLWMRFLLGLPRPDITLRTRRRSRMLWTSL